MRLDEGMDLMMEGISCFHGNFKKIIGQISLRINDNEYITTGDNKVLSGVKRSDIQICDITTGDLGHIFQQRDDINVIIFGCSKDIVEASNSGSSFAPSLDDLAYITGQSLGIIETATADSILSGIKNSGVCLAKGLGAFVAAKEMRSATTAILVIEKSAEAFVHGKMIGDSKPIDASIARELRANYKNDYLSTNVEDIKYVEYTEEEIETRNNMIKFVQQLAHDDLNYGSWGNVSILDGDSMLITPSAMEYDDISYADIVRVDLETLKSQDPRVPSMDAALHARMYKELPDCRAIIHTHSNGCSVFAACEAGFAITDPAMHQLIGDIKVVPYSPNQQKLADDVVSIMQDTHAAVLAHHGAIFYGPSIEAVYEIAKGVENMTQNLLGFGLADE